MQLGHATFVQPNLSFSTKSNYSIMMEGKTWKFLFNFFIYKQTSTLICRHGRGILIQFLVFWMINNTLVVFVES